MNEIEDKIKFRELLDKMHEVMDSLASEHMSPHTFGTGINLHRAEIHTVQAIGENEGINITGLASHMKVTKGAISQIVTKLIKKGIIKKLYADDNSKEVRLYLTEKGWTGFNSHNEMHMQLYGIVKEYFGAGFSHRLQEFTSVMEELNSILKILEKKKKTN